MKYIFRYALLTHFTNREQSLTVEQLNEALRAARFSLEGKNLQDLVDSSCECIEMLLKNSERRDLESAIREIYTKDNLTEGEIGDLLSTWQSEKHLVFKKLLTQNSKSGPWLRSVNWAVRNSIASRFPNPNQSPTFVLKINDSAQSTEYTLSKSDFTKFHTKIQEAQIFLNELFKNSA